MTISHAHNHSPTVRDAPNPRPVAGSRPLGWPVASTQILPLTIHDDGYAERFSIRPKLCTHGDANGGAGDDAAPLLMLAAGCGCAVAATSPESAGVGDCPETLRAREEL